MACRRFKKTAEKHFQNLQIPLSESWLDHAKSCKSCSQDIERIKVEARQDRDLRQEFSLLKEELREKEIHFQDSLKDKLYREMIRQSEDKYAKDAIEEKSSPGWLRDLIPLLRPGALWAPVIFLLLPAAFLFYFFTFPTIQEKKIQEIQTAQTPIDQSSQKSPSIQRSEQRTGNTRNQPDERAAKKSNHIQSEKKKLTNSDLPSTTKLPKRKKYRTDNKKFPGKTIHPNLLLKQRERSSKQEDLAEEKANQKYISPDDSSDIRLHKSLNKKLLREHRNTQSKEKNRTEKRMEGIQNNKGKKVIAPHFSAGQPDSEKDQLKSQNKEKKDLSYRGMQEQVDTKSSPQSPDQSKKRDKAEKLWKELQKNPRDAKIYQDLKKILTELKDEKGLLKLDEWKKRYKLQSP